MDQGVYYTYAINAANKYELNENGTSILNTSIVYNKGGFVRLEPGKHEDHAYVGFLSCIGKSLSDVKQLLIDNGIEFQLEEKDNCVAFIDPKTGNSISCETLLKDYLSTLSFLSQPSTSGSLVVALPPEFDSKQKAVYHRVLSSLTKIPTYYVDPSFALYIANCRLEDGLSKENIPKKKALILNIGRFCSTASVVEFNGSFLLKSSVSSYSASINSLARLTSQKLLQSELSSSTHQSEVLSRQSLNALMNVVVEAIGSVSGNTSTNLELQWVPGYEDKHIQLTIDMLKDDSYQEDLNTMIDTAMSQANVTINDLMSTILYSDYCIPHVISDFIYNKVGDKLNIIWDEKEDLFKMWYSGGDIEKPLAIGYAVSRDGEHWEKPYSEPVLKKDNSVLEKERVGACHVVQDGEQYVMFYTAWQDAFKSRICLARSGDGICWERHPENPIITGGQFGAWDVEAVYRPAAVHLEDKWICYYTGCARKNHRIGALIHEGNDLGFCGGTK